MKKILPFLLVVCACQKSNTQSPPPEGGFEKLPQLVPLSGGLLKETSGIADSRLNKGYLWAQQDSGNPPLIYLVKHDGTEIDSILVEGAVNRDWEDMAIGPGPDGGKTYVYVGDIGDNDGKYASCNIYRFEEPPAAAEAVTNCEKIEFSYEDGPHDAEAFLVDNITGDIYIITKRDAKSKIFRLAFPQNTAGLNEAEFVSELPYSGVTSASLSADGKEIIVKTYTALYYYGRNNDESIPMALQKAEVKLGYQLEMQGEAVSFSSDNSGFFTLSEEAMGVTPQLNFYKRK